MGFQKKESLFTPSRAVSYRRLRVGEEIRHSLSALLLKDTLPEPGLPTSVTITQIKMSSDLQYATVYFMPLGGQHAQEILIYLREVAGFIRYQMGKGLHLKYIPALRFYLDESFDQAQRIEKILKDVEE